MQPRRSVRRARAGVHGRDERGRARVRAGRAHRDVSGKVGSSYDIYIATRPTTNDPFNTPTLLGGISTPLDERAPSLLPSGAGLYVTYKSGGSADVAVAMKQAGSPPFVAPVSINGINSGVADQIRSGRPPPDSRSCSSPRSGQTARTGTSTGPRRRQRASMRRRSWP